MDDNPKGSAIWKQKNPHGTGEEWCRRPDISEVNSNKDDLLVRSQCLCATAYSRIVKRMVTYTRAVVVHGDWCPRAGARYRAYQKAQQVEQERFVEEQRQYLANLHLQHLFEAVDEKSRGTQVTFTVERLKDMLKEAFWRGADL